MNPLWRKAEIAAAKDDYVSLLLVWQSLVEAGESTLSAFIGDVYQRGAPHVPRNAEKAVYYYQRGVNEINDPMCHIGLGRSYLAGNGVKKDYARAKWHFETANAMHSSLAALYLGRMYFLGIGVAKDHALSKRYLAPLLNEGFVSAFFIQSNISFLEGRLIEGMSLWVRGWKTRNALARDDPNDIHLL